MPVILINLNNANMNNLDVINAFYDKKLGKNKNLTSTGNKLISYNTTIAERIYVDNITLIIKNITKYSSTTSKHQSLINKYNCVTKNSVPRNIANLKLYIDNAWI